jgi:WD40 repeat protein
MDLLAQWGAQDCVAVLQMLPETMWNRTVMNPGELLVSAHVAGLPNTGLVAEAHPDVPPYIATEMLEERRRRGAVAIPVITLDPRALGDYARVVAGLGRARVSAVDITVPSRPELPPEAHILKTEQETDPLALVRRFQATADPITQQLAGYLALLPLNLSIMQMVQTVLLPASRLAHLAEFLTSGLVYRDTEAEKAAGEPVFDFVEGVPSVGRPSEGVRELLQRTVRDSETLWVFRKVAEFLREEAGLGQGFSALAPHELGSETLVLNARTLPFARLQTDVLERMGMRADAEHMRERLEEQKPRAITLLREMPAQPDVYFRPAWSPDGSLFATPTRDGRILLWAPLQASDAPIRALQASRFGVNQASWSDDGKFLAAASFDHIVRVWEYPQETPLAELKVHRSDVRTVSYAPTTASQELATGTKGGTLRIWDPSRQKVIQTFHLHRGSINILQWTPEGKFLAFGCDDGAVGIYHWALKEPLLCEEQEISIRSLCWNYEESRLFTGSSGGEITSWTIVQETGTLHLDRRINAHRGVVNSLSLSHDGRVLASKSTDSTVRFWRADTLEYLDGFDEPSSGFTYASVAFHPSRPVLATTGEKDRSLRFWEVDLDALLATRAVAGFGPRPATKFPEGADVLSAPTSELPPTLLAPTGVHMAGDSAALDLVRQALATAGANGQPSVLVYEAKIEDQASLRLSAAEGAYRLSRAMAEGPLVAEVEGITPNSAKLIVEHLEHVARWEMVAGLENSATGLGAEPVEIAILRRITDAAGKETWEEILASTVRRRWVIGLNPSRAIRLKYTYSDGRWQQPRLRIELRNRRNQELHCALLWLGEDYSISSALLPGGMQRILPGESLAANAGEDIYGFVPDAKWREARTEVRDVLKLLVSTDPFDPRLFEQGALGQYHSVPSTREMERGLPSKLYQPCDVVTHLGCEIR